MLTTAKNLFEQAEHSRHFFATLPTIWQNSFGGLASFKVQLELVKAKMRDSITPGASDPGGNHSHSNV